MDQRVEGLECRQSGFSLLRRFPIEKEKLPTPKPEPYKRDKSTETKFGQNPSFFQALRVYQDDIWRWCCWNCLRGSCLWRYLRGELPPYIWTFGFPQIFEHLKYLNIWLPPYIWIFGFPQIFQHLAAPKYLNIWLPPCFWTFRCSQIFVQFDIWYKGLSFPRQINTGHSHNPKYLSCSSLNTLFSLLVRDKTT